MYSYGFYVFAAMRDASGIELSDLRRTNFRDDRVWNAAQWMRKDFAAIYLNRILRYCRRDGNARPTVPQILRYMNSAFVEEFNFLGKRSLYAVPRCGPTDAKAAPSATRKVVWWIHREVGGQSGEATGTPDGRRFHSKISANHTIRVLTVDGIAGLNFQNAPKLAIEQISNHPGRMHSAPKLSLRMVALDLRTTRPANVDTSVTKEATPRA